jgi:hypothetical protein
MSSISEATGRLADQSAELDVQARHDIRVSADGLFIEANSERITFDFAEQLAGQLDRLREQARGRRERHDLIEGLHSLAHWLLSHDVGPIYSLDSLSVFFEDNDRVAGIAAAAGLDTELASFGSGPDRLQAEVVFGPVKLRIVGKPVEAEVIA